MDNNEVSKYDKQAADFLAEYKIKFTATYLDKQTCPLWDDDKHVHGDKYRITFSRNDGLSAARMSFHFWNSWADTQEGKEPDAYSVLACCGSDVNCPETYEDFCSEFGYNEDSRKAERTFKAASKQAEKLRAFFTTEEIEALQEIR